MDLSKALVILASSCFLPMNVVMLERSTDFLSWLDRMSRMCGGCCIDMVEIKTRECPVVGYRLFVCIGAVDRSWMIKTTLARRLGDRGVTA